MSAGAVRAAGEVSDLLMAAARLAVREPNRAANTLPYALQLGDFDAYENSCLTVAEVAAVRWLQVARAASDPLAGAELAAQLWKQRVHMLALDPDGRVPRAFADLVGLPLARELALLLTGRVYLVPLPPWTVGFGEAIYQDVLRERAVAFEAAENFALCPERSALLERCEALARGAP